MDSEKERYGISLAVTIFGHLGAALLLGLTGFLFVKPPSPQEPIEIVLEAGGGHAGGGHEGEFQAEQPDPAPKENHPAPEENLPDFTETESQEVPVEDTPATSITTPSTTISSTQTTTSANGEGTEDLSIGSGTGGGEGSGTGDGEGDGNGSGEGNGDGLGSGDGEGSGTNPGVPVTPPTLQNYVEPQYPGRAILDGTTGMVQVKITVNAAGTVDAVMVTSSSGSGTLDQAAVDAVYQWTFSPALDTQGRPTACTIYVPVTFKMQ